MSRVKKSDPKSRVYMLALDISEGVQVAKEHGIHYGKTVFVRNAEQLKGLAGLTMVMCPRFHDRSDAAEIIKAARDRHCQIIKPEALRGSAMVVRHG